MHSRSLRNNVWEGNAWLQVTALKTIVPRARCAGKELSPCPTKLLALGASYTFLTASLGAEDKGAFAREVAREDRSGHAGLQVNNRPRKVTQEDRIRRG